MNFAEKIATNKQCQSLELLYFFSQHQQFCYKIKKWYAKLGYEEISRFDSLNTDILHDQVSLVKDWDKFEIDVLPQEAALWLLLAS